MGLNIVPWKDLIDAQAAGNATGDFLINAANKGREIWCNTFAQAPGALVRGGFDFPPNQFFDGLFRRMCSDMPSGLPDAPQKQFTGGQCPVRYTITFSGRYKPNGNTFPGSVQVIGPIGPLQSGTFSGIGYAWYVSAQSIFDAGNVKPIILFSVDVNDRKDYDCTITNIVRQDGNPDNCGDPPLQYPPVAYPTNIYAPQNVNIRVTPTQTINVPIKIDRLQIGGDNYFQPKVQIDVNGIKIQFGGGGIEFGIPKKPGQPQYIPIGDGGNSDPAGEPDWAVTGGSCDLTPVITQLDSLDEKYSPLLDCERCDNWDYTQVTQDDRGSGIILCAAGYKPEYVALTLTTTRAQPKVESGGANAPEVIWAGFLSWGSSSGWSERVPIDRSLKWLPAPAGADRVAYTFYEGYRGNALMQCRKRATT